MKWALWLVTEMKLARRRMFDDVECCVLLAIGSSDITATAVTECCSLHTEPDVILKMTVRSIGSDAIALPFRRRHEDGHGRQLNCRDKAGS